MLIVCYVMSPWMIQYCHRSASVWLRTFFVFGEGLHPKDKISIGTTYKMGTNLTAKRNCGYFGMEKNQILQAWSILSLLVSQFSCIHVYTYINLWCIFQKLEKMFIFMHIMVFLHILRLYRIARLYVFSIICMFLHHLICLNHSHTTIISIFKNLPYHLS